MAASVSGSTAEARNLQQGTAYSFGLFTKVGRAWLGPIPLTATTTSSDANSATYITNPETVVVPRGQELGAKPVANGRVTTQLPSGSNPVAGAVVVLPISATLPGGFVGRHLAGFRSG
jgi:hypothetical protein